MIVADGDLLIDADGTALDAADADTADIVVIIDGGDKHLHGRRGVALRRRDIVDDGIEQRVEIHARLVRRVAGDALPRGAEQRRNCSSVAFRSSSSSSTSSMTSSTRASSRSILLTTTMTL